MRETEKRQKVKKRRVKLEHKKTHKKVSLKIRSNLKIY